jgi:hypothetical protein
MMCFIRTPNIIKEFSTCRDNSPTNVEVAALGRDRLRCLFEIARWFLRFDHVASIIVNANYGIM